MVKKSLEKFLTNGLHFCVVQKSHSLKLKVWQDWTVRKHLEALEWQVCGDGRKCTDSLNGIVKFSILK